jgi:hypothetical protein
MIDIIFPDIATTRDIQSKQGRYYWSRACEVLFRKEGVISVQSGTAPSKDCTLQIICRDVIPPQANDICLRVFEGPLSDELQAMLGIYVQTCVTDTVILENDPLLSLHLPEILVRNQDKSVCPYLFNEANKKWANCPLKIQFLEGKGWDAILYAVDPLSGREGPVAVRRDRDMVFGFSVFDLLTRWLTIPPLTTRYGGFARMMNHDMVTRKIISLVVDHAVSAGVPPLIIDRWPKGYSAAFTVRHDYDRKADPVLIQALLALYEELGVWASIGFLPYLLELETLEAFQSKKHEIQAHISSATQLEFRESLRLLRSYCYQPPCGITIHGGPKGIGFRGQTHFEWLDDTGIDYCEMFGIRDTIPMPVCRLYDDIPDFSRLIGTPEHMSFDGSTLPQDHKLNTFLDSVPKSLASGNYAIVMNHPDVHHEQLLELVSNIDFEGVWLTTMKEAVAWHRITRYESLAHLKSRGYMVWFPKPLPYKAVLRLGSSRFEIDLSERSAFIHDNSETRLF